MSSPGVRINSYAQVTDSILFDGVDVGRYAASGGRSSTRGYRSRRHGDRLRPDEDRRRFTVTEGGITVVSKGMELEPMREVVNA